MLAELGDLSHPDIARVIGCSPAKVKALVFQARTTLIAERDARRTPCDEIRALLDTARAGSCGAARCAGTCASAIRARPIAPRSSGSAPASRSCSRSRRPPG